jgi:hypothetical protein
MLGRNVKLNRAGAATGHSLAEVAATVRDVALTHERALAWGNMTFSLGYSDVDSAGSTAGEDGVRGFLTWSRRLR